MGFSAMQTRGGVSSSESFVLTDDEIDRRKRYLEIAPDDERRLLEAHPLVQSRAPEIINRFYDYLLSHRPTREMLGGPGLIERLKRLQLEYFLELTCGRYDRRYFESRIRVGETHHRVGLSPEWYTGAYLKYLHIVTDVLSSAFGRDQERFYQTLVALTKIMHLDMGIALDVYHWKAQAELRKKAEELEQSNEQLLQLQASKRLLSDMIVHDLQNPLAGIQAFLQVLQERLTGQPPGVLEALEEGLRRCYDLFQMIQNVLFTSRSETGTLTAKLEDVDIVKVVGEAAKSFGFAFDEGGRRLTIEAPGARVVSTDPQLARRIVENLIRNTLRHTPRGTPVTVRVEATPSGGTRCSVIDTGPGIPPALHHLLFDPLGAPELRQAGLRVDTGLGLAFCRVAAKAVGGDIRVESDGRSGTAFHVTFPALRTGAGVGAGVGAALS